jgi:hypothetical protein
MFGLFKRRPSSEQTSRGEREVVVFLNPLIMLLAGREREKGSHLTEEEVIAVRDGAACVLMTESQAATFYANLDAQFPYPRIDPERVWEQWQEVRDQIQWQ